MLRLENLEASYGDSQVLFGLSLEVGAGEAVALCGRNGMGKTTTVRTIMGLLPPRAGSIHFAGESIGGQAPYQVARAGLGLVPEGRQVFPNLTVRENLVATARPTVERDRSEWSLSRVFALFPHLAARAQAYGLQLSGGEQQMLSIGRALMTNPKLLILDEATEGLAPLIRAEIWRVLTALKAAGQSILVIDKDLAALSRLASRLYFLEKGRVVWSGTPAALRRDPEIAHRHLGV